MTLGELVSSALREKGLSLREAAKATGLSHNHIRNLMVGTDSRTKEPIRPSFEVLKRISSGLGISYISLLDAAGYLPSETPAAVLEWLVKPGNLQLVEDMMNDPRDYALAVRVIRQYQSERDSSTTEK